MSQCDSILAHLKLGHGITTLIAMHPPFNCCRLSERIAELERDGWVILHTPIKTDSGKRVMYYTLVGRKQVQLSMSLIQSEVRA